MTTCPLLYYSNSEVSNNLIKFYFTSQAEHNSAPLHKRNPKTITTKATHHPRKKHPKYAKTIIKKLDKKRVREEDRVLGMIKQHFKVSLMLPAIYHLVHFTNVRFPPGNTCFQKIVIALMSGSGKKSKQKKPNKPKQKCQTNKKQRAQDDKSVFGLVLYSNHSFVILDRFKTWISILCLDLVTVLRLMV